MAQVWRGIFGLLRGFSSGPKRKRFELRSNDPPKLHPTSKLAGAAHWRDETARRGAPGECQVQMWATRRIISRDDQCNKHLRAAKLNSEPGASVYSPTVLKLYDLCVNGLSHRFVWQCPTKSVLLPFYKEHLGLKHLDVGVGTGFFIARAGLTSSHQVGLLDLNENCLRAAAAQVKLKFKPSRPDLMQPSSEPADTGYDSISMFHVLHCLPGTMDDKETAIANLKRYLSKTGVLYGVTILGKKPAIMR